MNQKLVQINDNIGVISDENGMLSLINKENNSYGFEEILLKENNLEELKTKLEYCKNEMSFNKQDMIGSIVGNIILIIMEIIAFIFLYSALPLGVLIAINIITYILFKGTLLLMCGTRKGRHIKKNKLTTYIGKLELEISKLEKELKESKEKSKYKILENNETKIEVSSKKSYNQESFPSKDYYTSENIDKVKVLSLSKRV